TVEEFHVRSDLCLTVDLRHQCLVAEERRIQSTTGSYGIGFILRVEARALTGRSNRGAQLEQAQCVTGWPPWLTRCNPRRRSAAESLPAVTSSEQRASVAANEAAEDVAVEVIEVGAEEEAH